jgi:hypothetical protein
MFISIGGLEGDAEAAGLLPTSIGPPLGIAVAKGLRDVSGFNCDPFRNAIL